MKKGKERNQSGITLIALIITIVVLLILVAVTISLTLGERGIFNTAQQAGKNYKEASDKELADLSNLEKEMQNAINGTVNGGSTSKPEAKPVKLNTLDATHYGDYVDYPVNIGRGPAGIAETHKSDWRIFYNDGTYVYLIASYLLLNSQVPAEIGMSGAQEKPYATYWKTEQSYTAIIENVRTNYKMNWNKNETNANIKAVSTLLDTTKWTKFVNSQYAEDAIGAPTLEMWIESWNEVSAENKLYYNNINENGYYVGDSNVPITSSVAVDGDNNLYFPVTTDRKQGDEFYWLSSPSAIDYLSLMVVNYYGAVGHYGYAGDSVVSLRPLVRLKSNVLAKQENGVWKLQ